MHSVSEYLNPQQEAQRSSNGPGIPKALKIRGIGIQNKHIIDVSKPRFQPFQVDIYVPTWLLVSLVQQDYLYDS